MNEVRHLTSISQMMRPGLHEPFRKKTQRSQNAYTAASQDQGLTMDATRATGISDYEKTMGSETGGPWRRQVARKGIFANPSHGKNGAKSKFGVSVHDINADRHIHFRKLRLHRLRQTPHFGAEVFHADGPVNFMRQAAKLNVDEIIAESFLECVLKMLGEISVHKNGSLPLRGQENVSKKAAALPRSGIVSEQKLCGRAIRFF